ncbi:MAG TPA: PLP-dependent aminotransferase family protein, partial [Ktedonobacter sp.]|nr:PLP-dependent aminotransferase family protein [Ktedonobacter sp.]
LLRDLNAEHVLTLSSYSKLISPSLRVGYLIGPADFVKQLTKLAEETTLAPVLPTQAAVVEFYKRGYYASNLENLKTLYAPRLQAIIEALKTHMPDVPFAEPQGGFFVSIYMPETTDCSTLLKRAQEHGLTLTNGQDFFADTIDGTADPIGQRFVRLPFCALTPEQIEEGVRRLATLQ